MTRTDCYPWWHATYNALPRIAVSSGCSTSGGNVQCSPESMRAAAEAKLRVAGYWTGNRPLSLEAYTMARYITSEVGSGSVEDQAAVGEAAINQAAKWKLKNGILSLLLYRQSSAHPNYGYYGPIQKFPAAACLRMRPCGLGRYSAPHWVWAPSLKPFVSPRRMPSASISVRTFGSLLVAAQRSYGADATLPPWIGP